MLAGTGAGSAVGPARFAKLDATLGTIDKGKIADLVVLDANPLENIRNTRSIFAVAKGGKVYSRSELDVMLAAVRRAVAQ